MDVTKEPGTPPGSFVNGSARRLSRRSLLVAAAVTMQAGVAFLAAATFPLWGTGAYAFEEQRQLRRSFEEVVIAAAPSSEAPATSAHAAAPASVPERPTLATEGVAVGEPMAIIRIPRIAVDHVVVEGVGARELRKGPGHYPQTPRPGAEGNVAIAGHRTTYGSPFARLDELVAGDEIVLVTAHARFVYLVAGSRIVKPTQVDVLHPTPAATLTLTTCHPRNSAKERLVVTATLAPAPAANRV